MQERKENITVAVRIRPLQERELSSNPELSWQGDGESTIKELKGTREFSFDRVYNSSSHTTEIFTEIAQGVISKCLSGYNGCIFCYGQTGSGKTFTMHGNKKSPGIVPLAIESMFELIRKSFNKEFLIRCSYVELYNESINDLLDSDRLNLQLAEDRRSGIKIVGVTEEVCTSPNQVQSLLSVGEKHKNIASTAFNQRSSRAHSIFRVIVESKNSSGKSDLSIASLNLIDLAGSESANVHNSAASSARTREMKYINRSLLTLGTVIMRLSDTKNSAPIPYRDSKLTRLLQPALEGDSKVNIICNISPCTIVYEETLSTLKFAQRAKKIKQTIVKNDVSNTKALITKYQQEILQLQERLKEMENRMSHEINSVMPDEVSHQLVLLQEEKEKADTRLESLLQEKIQLQKELERFKSFIIHPENIRSSKISIVGDDDFDLIDCRKSIDYIQKIKGDVVRPGSGTFPTVSMKDERLLTDNIERIDEVLDSDEPLARCSVEEKKTQHVDCFRVIDEQDKLIKTLQKAMQDKDEEILLLKDELTLCRNNLATMQRNLRKHK